MTVFLKYFNCQNSLEIFYVWKKILLCYFKNVCYVYESWSHGAGTNNTGIMALLFEILIKYRNISKIFYEINKNKNTVFFTSLVI